MYPDKAKFAVTGLVLALTLALGVHVQLSIALLTGALFMILSKVLTIDEAYKAVDWMTVFLLPWASHFRKQVPPITLLSTS